MSNEKYVSVTVTREVHDILMAVKKATRMRSLTAVIQEVVIERYPNVAAVAAKIAADAERQQQEAEKLLGKRS